MTVLVTAATRHGGTSEIADVIGATLSECGIATVVRSLEDVSDLTGYDAVVLGSAVYAGRWLHPARRFVEGHAAELSARPTWLFSSGPIGDPPKPGPEAAVRVDDVVTLTHAREHRLFAGRLERHDLGLAERAVVRVVNAADGDYRDWDAIRDWAGSIAEQLETGDRRPG